MADHTDRRTRRQKLQAMADDPGASEGERANARSILERMGPEPTPSTWDTIKEQMRGGAYQPPQGPEAQAAGRHFSYRDWYDTFYGFGAYDRSQTAQDRRRQSMWEEELRRAQAQETLRRAGFAMPGDLGFESEYTARAADAQETFRRFRQNTSWASGRGAADVDDTERLMRDYLEGRASVNDLRRHMGMEEP